MIPLSTPARVYLVATTAAVGLLTVGIGVWALASADAFAAFFGFAPHEHFVHDVGAFQFGLGLTLLLALIWSDALLTILAGYIVANTIHTVNHIVDLDLGGSPMQAWLLGALGVALIAAFVVRLRQLGGVVGAVGVAALPALEPFVRQKTVRLTTFRKDGTASTSPVSIVVDGDRAYFRSYEKAFKTRRIRRDPAVEVGPSTATGKATGPMLSGRARLLDGDEYGHASRLLARKYPVLHGVVVPCMHRLSRRKMGRTVHAELVLLSPRDVSPEATAPSGAAPR